MLSPLARFAVVVALLVPVPVVAAPPTFPAEALVIPAVTLGGRNPLPVDPVAVSLADPKRPAPRPGDKVTALGGIARNWTAAPIKDGVIPMLAGGYAYVPVTSDAARVVVLQASGHLMVFVNGEPRVGDVYGSGYVRLPVALREGVNDFYFAAGRGPVTAKLLEPKAVAEFDGGDVTAPDFRVGVATDTFVAIPVRNCSNEAVGDLVLEAVAGTGKPVATAVPPMLPVSFRKVALRLVAEAPEKPGPVPVTVRLMRRGKPEPLDTLELKLTARSAEETHRRTFVSEIDGSVQYYSVVPAKPTDDGKRPGLVLTLHGAAVEASRQAECYTRKSGLHVVAATNRRPFGFDWEDWGRLDALEVLDRAMRELNTEPRRTYLTGHSMGGHGTWHIGVTYPDRFAAIAPSAGWVSMWSYAGMKKDVGASAERELVLRSSGPSDTLSLLRNITSNGVFVLHGDLDDNVPVDQARIMRRALAEFHPDFVYREQPGAGHWWGNECMDWPAIFDFFPRRELPERANVRRIDFRTANPRVSADCHWLRIEAQQRAFLLSRAEFMCDPAKQLIQGTTENVARLSFDLSPLSPDKPVRVELDSQVFADLPRPRGEARLWFHREGEKWTPIPKPNGELKGPHRAGAFKDVFRNNVVFVYGTKGTAAENAWAMGKARYDAEVFWYRGNGSIDVVADTAFNADADRNRNVVLYGHSGMNACWKPLLGDSPIQVSSGTVRVGERDTRETDLGVLFVRPRPGSDRAMVGVIAGTGLVGLRFTERLPYFASGVGYPDWVVFDARGVVGAGHFGNNWKLESGESGWRKDDAPDGRD